MNNRVKIAIIYDGEGIYERHCLAEKIIKKLKEIEIEIHEYVFEDYFKFKNNWRLDFYTKYEKKYDINYIDKIKNLFGGFWTGHENNIIWNKDGQNFHLDENVAWVHAELIEEPWD